MTKKIFRSTVAVGLAVLLASLVIIMGALYTYFGHVQEQQLRDELSIAAAAMESGDGEAYLSKLHSDNYRITWLRADGTVLYDTKADAAAMENHAQREEVRQALTNGTGESSRYSATLLEKTLYYARRLPDGTVLRLSASRVTMGVLLLSMLSAILAVIAVALILSGILAGRVSRRITRPLNTLDLEHPLENDAYEELSPLLRRLEHQRRQIDDQLRSLRRRSEEFEQITASMTEGLVLVDNGGTILSMNPAACAVFHTDAACVGQPLLTVERGSAVSHALHDAMDTGHGETRMERDGREYQFDMTRIQADGEVVGAVLLTFTVVLVAGMNLLTVPSVSLEGEQLWQLQSLPVTPWQVLRAKLDLHLLVTLPPALLCLACGLVLLRAPWTSALLAGLLVALDVVFTAAAGLMLGVAMPRFHWTSEMAVIKQNPSVLLALLVNWAAGFVLGVGVLVLAQFVPVEAAWMAALGILALADGAALRWLKTKGAKKLQAL